jgi:hypothetical protein
MACVEELLQSSTLYRDPFGSGDPVGAVRLAEA